jgi:predicted aspartyl protease
VNFTTLSKLPKGAPVMMGTFSINHQPVIILFDSGAAHNFISSKCGTKVGLDLYPTRGTYMITTPSGKISSNQIYRKVPIQLGSNLIKNRLTVIGPTRNGCPPRHGLDD